MGCETVKLEVYKVHLYIIATSTQSLMAKEDIRFEDNLLALQLHCVETTLCAIHSIVPGPWPKELETENN